MSKFGGNTKDDVFKRDTVVDIKHPLILGQAYSVIQEVDNTNMCITRPESAGQVKIGRGDRVYLKKISGHYEYVAECIADDDGQVPNACIKLYIEQIVRYNNKRKHKRYPVNYNAKFYIGKTGAKINGTVKNISLSGIYAIMDRRLDIGSEVNACITTHLENMDILTVRSMIVKVIPHENLPFQPYYEYGMEITGIDDFNQDILDRIIFSLKTYEDHYQSRLLTL